MAPRLALLALALAVLPAGSVSGRAVQSPTVSDAIAWFDTLGYPNAKDLPYVRVATGSWIQTGNQPRESQFVEGFLIREDSDSFTVFLCSVAPSFALGADDVGARSFAPLTTVRFVRKDSGPVSEQIHYQRLDFRTVANDVLDRVRQHTSINDGALFDSIWQPVTHRGRIFAFARACLQSGLSEVGVRLLQIAADIPIGQTGRVDPRALRDLLQQQLGDAVLNQAEADATVAKVPWNELLRTYSAFESRFPASDRLAYAREASETLQRMIAEGAGHESKPLAQMSTDEQVAENIYQLRNLTLAPPYWSTGGPYPVASERRDGKDVPTPVHRLVDLGFSAVPRLIAALDDHTFTRSQVARFKGYELPKAMRVSDFARNILSFMSGRNFSQSVGSDGTPIAGTDRQRAEAWWTEVRGKGDKQSTAPPGPPAAQPSVSPVRASLAVRLSAGKTIYHVGEEIVLDLEFRGTADKDYFFSTSACGFFGRFFWTEHVAVTPPGGIDDPLADLFSSGGYGGSCPSSWHPLDDTPLVIRVSMNDAVRFTRPGTYKLIVSSTRLGRYSRQSTPVLTSAPIDLTIAPMDDAWAAAEVGLASDLIRRGDVADVRHGAAMLRYLGTQAAALSLVANYDTIAKADVGEVTAGLISSPRRALIVKQMEAHVDEGGNLDATFLDTLTRLRVLLDLPATPGNAIARRERTTVVQAEYDARWRTAIARHAMTAATLGAELARLQTNPSVELQQQIAHDLEQHPAQAADAFGALPLETQQVLLQSAIAWAHLSRPWIVTPLQQVYARWHGRGNPGGFSMGPGDTALRRLYELVPDEGRRLILEEIRTGEHGIGYDALAILPEAELPELDAALQARYSSAPKADFGATLGDRGTTAWLMARYGSANLLPFVTGLLTRRLPGCVVEGGLITYLLKHDPAAAMKRLDPTFDRTAPATCVAPLTAVAAHHWDDRIEAAAIAQLMVADVRRVIDAAQLLGSHGSSAAKQPLLDRLAKWSAEWRDRAAELVARGPGVAYPPQVIENNIVNALFHNERFGLTRDDVENIRALCLTDQCRTDVDRRARSIREPRL